MPRWNISHIHLIYLICPFSRDPIESIWKGEPCSKKISRKVTRQIFCPSHSQQPNHIFYSQFSQVATDRGFLLVQEMARHVTVPWRAAMCCKAEPNLPKTLGSKIKIFLPPRTVFSAVFVWILMQKCLPSLINSHYHSSQLCIVKKKIKTGNGVQNFYLHLDYEIKKVLVSHE